MSFWEHLEVLRGVLWRVAIIIIILAIILFLCMHWIFDSVILAPCHGDFPLYKLFDIILATSQFSVSLINIKLASQFYLHISTSCWLAITIAFPFIMHQIWLFISPALYEHEKRSTRVAFVFGTLMFYIGVAIGYFLVFPLMLRFLADYQLSPDIPNTISIDSYMDNFFMITLLMGIVFELPLLAWLLGKIGFLTRIFFATYRRHAIVVLLIIAAMITPTGDPFTLSAVFFPIYFLWELSSRLVPKTKTTF